jgi:hypothetical protein
MIFLICNLIRIKNWNIWIKEKYISSKMYIYIYIHIYMCVCNIELNKNMHLI